MCISHHGGQALLLFFLCPGPCDGFLIVYLKNHLGRESQELSRLGWSVDVLVERE